MEHLPLTIRTFETADLATLQEIQSLAFAPVVRSFRELVGADIAEIAFQHAEREQAQLLADICKPGATQRVFVAEMGGRIAGFVSFSADQTSRMGEIGLNAVHPSFAGRGIGTKLYVFALETMKAAGMKAAVVGTGADESHAPARRAYEKAGFGPGVPSLWLYRML